MSSPETPAVVRVALAQLPVRVGDLAGNTARVRAAMASAERAGADLLLTPEMTISGHPVEDLLASPDFLDAAERATQAAAAGAGDTVTLIGAPMGPTALPAAGGARTDTIGLDAAARTARNVAAAAQHGRLAAAHAKTLLPTYSVFDDARHVVAGLRDAALYRIGGALVAVLVCEDVWTSELPAAAVAAGAQLIAVMNASPYQVGKSAQRRALVAGTARRCGVPVAYVNCVGGQDEVVFDGASLVAAADGAIVAEGAAFAEDFLVVDVEVPPARGPATRKVIDLPARTGVRPPLPARAGRSAMSVEEEVYTAAVTGLRDYFARTGFTRAVLGLSGGIDSALVAVMAADALGPDNVWGVGLPGPYSSQGSVTDARALADNIKIRFDVVPIVAAYAERLGVLAGLLDDDTGAEASGAPVARENLQARLRAATLMTLANAHPRTMLLATGNKSESSVGYFTLYGDSCGGVNVLGDIPKTDVTYRDGTRMPGVFTLARWRNAHALTLGQTPPIPESTLTKPPSAELAADQRDEDSLPPYPILDPLLCAFLEEHATPDDLVRDLLGKGYDLAGAHATVTRVLRLIEASEWKRRQVPFRIQLTRLSFGRDRRMPLANAWRYTPTPLDAFDAGGATTTTSDTTPKESP